MSGKNPTITPLVRECNSKDTILVQINPGRAAGTNGRTRAKMIAIPPVSTWRRAWTSGLYSALWSSAR